MRGNPYLRLRRTVARALRRAIAGSVAVALLAIGFAVAATATPGHSEATELAGPPPTVAALDRLAGPPPIEGESNPLDIAPDLVAPLESIVPDLAASLDVVEPPTLEAVAPSEGTRRVGISAIGQLAGPPLTEDERRAAAVQRAAERDDVPEVIEPPFVVTLSRNPGLTASPPLAAGDVIEATVSFYYCEQGDTPDGGDGGGFCGAMRDGTIVYEGAAACAFTYLGQRFRIVGDPTERTYTCHDTGSAVHGLHRDIFFYSAADGWPWIQSVGTRAILEIVE